MMKANETIDKGNNQRSFLIDRSLNRYNHNANFIQMDINSYG